MLSRVQNGVDRQLQACNQRLDLAASRFSRPSHFVTRQQARLAFHAQKLQHAGQASLSRATGSLHTIETAFPKAVKDAVQDQNRRLDSAQLRLDLLSPRLVLKRGYAWLTDAEGLPISSTRQTRTGQAVRATLVDGEVDLTVSARRLI